ncbi:MAG: ComEC/Rec2 family competence protein [Chthoniobacteraceae bacterium]
MRPRLPFLGLALAAVAGIVLADRFALPAAVLIGTFVVSALASLFVPRTWLCAFCASVSFASVHTFAFKQNPARVVAARMATVSGLVASDPEPLPYFAFRQTGTFRLRPEDGDVLVTWCGPLPAYGDRVTVSGWIEAIERPRNPGQLDFASHLARSGVFAQLETKYPQDCRIDARGAGNPLIALSLRTSRWMQEQLRLDIEDSPELATLIASMVLGMRGETPAETTDMFRTTGTLHLFAVSGLNIAMLAIIAAYVLKPLGLGRRFVATTTIPILIFYALVTGLSASCVRAAIMGSLVLLALLFERRGVVYNSLAAAAVLILAWDTNQLFVPGFQFSFVLVFTIVWLAGKISRRLEPLGHPDPFLPKPLWTFRQRTVAFASKMLAAVLGVTLASWIGSLLFMAGYFHIVSPSAIFANLIAVPIAFCVLALGLATVLAALVAKPVAILFSNANWLCAKALLASVQVFALMPGGHLYVELPRAGPPPQCELTVLDVGAGAAIHLRSGRHDWLIDGGKDSRFRNVALPYLRSRGVNRLDALVLTHGDAQHIGGAIEALDDFTPKLILDSTIKDLSPTRRGFHAALAEAHRGKVFARRGDEFVAGAARVRVLFPPAGWKRPAADDKALVILVECEGRSVLLMSDSGVATERWLIEHEPALRADVIVKGHHGKDFSGTADFLAHVRPAAIVVGAPDFRAPAPQSLDEWTAATRSRGVTVFRQDECGAVSVRIRDGAIELAGFVNAQRFRAP